MAGLAKGLAILEAFSADRRSLRIADAARITGITPPAARRCLLTLADLGYLRQDGACFYPTPRLARLACSYLETDPLTNLAWPHLDEAREQLAESVSLAVLEDGLSLFVARAESQQIVLTGVRVGSQLPAYGTATGRALLAGLSDEDLNQYFSSCHPVARTPASVVDIDELRSLVLNARREGYAYTDEELALGMRSVAVPIVDSRKRVRAALSTSAFSGRVSLETMVRQFVPVLRRHADAIGRML